MIFSKYKVNPSFNIQVLGYKPLNNLSAQLEEMNAKHLENKTPNVQQLI